MKVFVFALVMFISVNVSAGDSAGIAGMVVTNKTVENNNFIYPSSINTVYFPNDPAEGGILLIYLSVKKLGVHTVFIELTDQKGKYIDSCAMEPFKATKLPWNHTMTCTWGGRQSDGGINFNIYNSFEGKREKLSELFLAPAPKS